MKRSIHLFLHKSVPVRDLQIFVPDFAAQRQMSLIAGLINYEPERRLALLIH